MSTCRQIAAQMVSPGKGILAADESIATMSSRLKNAGVNPTAQSRRDYRELLVTTPGLADCVSGIIFCDETLNQVFSDGRPFAQGVRELGMLPGIKVDTGAKPCPGLPGETITEGLDDLAARLARYAEIGQPSRSGARSTPSPMPARPGARSPVTPTRWPDTRQRARRPDLFPSSSRRC